MLSSQSDSVFSPGVVASFQAELRNRVQGENETLDALRRDIRKLVARAYPQGDEAQLGEEEKTCFIEAVRDVQLRVKLRDFNPLTLDAAEEMAKRFQLNLRTESRKPSAEQPEVKPVSEAGDKVQAVVMEEPGYVRRLEEGLTNLSTRLDKVSAQRQQKPKPKQNKGGGREHYLCYGGRQPGHFKRDCPYRAVANLPPQQPVPPTLYGQPGYPQQGSQGNWGGQGLPSQGATPTLPPPQPRQ